MLALAMGSCGVESKVWYLGVERDMGSEPLTPLGLKRK